ncbi:hypothetical protein F4Y93_09895 [Candidatus Poribacteria bacterium]|nr:hypothetical protein [Candidatus Poribacteria bacterium]
MSIVCFVFVGSILLVGCAAPAHLAQKSEPTQDKKIQQTMDRWKGTHISKAIQKWGSPNEVTSANDGTGGRIYTWIVPVREFLVGPEVHISEFQLRPHSSSRHAARRENLSTDHTFKIVFHTRPDGAIYKTYIKK